MEAYRKTNREVKEDIKQAKQQWIEGECNRTEQSFRTNNTKEAFRTVKQLTNQKSTRSSRIEDKDGNLLTQKDDIANRWHEYCSDLYNYQISAEVEALQELKEHTSSNSDEDPEIGEDEIEAAIRSPNLVKHQA